MAKEETPRVTLVIPARNEEKYISKCLDSVLKQEFQNFETIVVDNGSTDQTAKIVRGYAKDGIKYVYEAEPGLPKARQVGLENAKGDILVNVDADCTIPPNYIGTIAKYFIDNPSVVGLSNPFYFHDGSIGLRGFVKLFFGVFNILSRLKIFRFLFGGSFAVRKSVLNRAGGFNTSIKFWGEDADLSRRIVQEGEIRFLPKLVVWTSARRFNRFGFFKTSYKLT